MEKIENILQYLDENLHPIISPEHWNIYSELHDMVSCLSMEPQWIPCSERLPFVDEYGKSDQVLATCGLRGGEAASIRWLRILYFNGCNWCFPTGESYEQTVYAWMPSPELWEGGQDNA